MKTRIYSMKDTKNKRKFLLIAGIVIISVIVASIVINEVNNKQVSAEKLVDTLYNGETFEFRGIDWFVSKEEMLNHENIKQNDGLEVRPNVIKHPQKITFKEVELNVETILYNFTDEPNMLVSGEYWATFEDKDKYLATVEKVKSALDSEFKSFTRSEDDFNPLQYPSDSIIWRAEDESRLTFSVFGDNVDTERIEPYTINIHVSAPPPARDIP
ncbi:hypothetical protein M6D81_03690 [Paenibacillus sp. J5C_2022]|nr:hypothetical protein [Paenibacillus sp. J5C2022]